MSLFIWRQIWKTVPKNWFYNKTYFQQENYPKHIAHNVRHWIPHFPKTLPQSLFLNPMEHLWDQLARREKNHKKQLKQLLLKDWQNAGIYTTRNAKESSSDKDLHKNFWKKRIITAFVFVKCLIEVTMSYEKAKVSIFTFFSEVVYLSCILYTHM